MARKIFLDTLVKVGSFTNQTSNGVHSAALILGAAGLCSRILGVLRDRMLASQFGAGRELDIYYAAFQIPVFRLRNGLLPQHFPGLCFFPLYFWEYRLFFPPLPNPSSDF